MIDEREPSVKLPVPNRNFRSTAPMVPGTSTPCAYTPNAYILKATMPDPREYLPLSSPAFEVLLTLAGGDQHGYRIMRDVADRSGGAVTLHAGTLYRTLARLLDTGLIEELGERPDGIFDDQRRRYYRLTP